LGTASWRATNGSGADGLEHGEQRLRQWRRNDWGPATLVEAVELGAAAPVGAGDFSFDERSRRRRRARVDGEVGAHEGLGWSAV
jgi:hypothetical protein